MTISKRQTVLLACVGASLAAVLAVQMTPAAHADATSTVAPARVDDFVLADQDLFGRQLYRMGEDKAVVLLAYRAGDAQVHADAPALMALKAAYAGKGVELLAIDSQLGETRAKVIADAKAAGLELPILFDYEQLTGEALGLNRAAEVIVVDPKTWTVAYRGALTGPGGEPLARNAVDALVAGRKVTLAAAPARGGAIPFPERAHAAEFAKISYAQSVVPIIQAKCAGCHQPGGIGPMPLNTYEQIKGFSPMIREVIRTHRMPPFQPDQTTGRFQDDARLSPQQMKTLVHWIDAGAPRGAGEDPLKKVSFAAAEWPLGKPDKIVDIPEVKIPASGVLEYQYPSVSGVMQEGRWLRATAFRISDRQAVHHILTGVAPEGQPSGAAVAQNPFATLLHGYVPGVGYMKTAIGTGIWVPPSSGLAFQAHYTTYGRESAEKTQVGLYFYPKGETPQYLRRTFGIFDFSLEIPAGEVEHKEIAYIEIPKDAVIYAFTPHSHKRGVSAKVSIRYPNGKEDLLLAVPRYDFNWQYDYVLEKPLTVPAGSKIITRWIYDNSTRNPVNPDPKKTVYWGEQSFEEMLAVYIHYHWVGETAKNPKEEYEPLLKANAMIGVLDDNLDGKIELAELRGGPQSPGQTLKKYFAAIDTDHDGSIDKAEMAVAQKLLARGRRSNAAATPAPAPLPAAPVAAAGSGAAPGGR
jgi:peroxiredoxin/mono/diheme cytochrome c family protein